MARKISYNDIRNINEDWAYDDRNGNPYSGRSVQDFIKKTLNEKSGDFYFDADTTKYLIFANKDNRDLYLSDREQYSDLLLGSFDAPANYTAKITMLTPLNNVVLSGTTGNYIDFTFDIVDKDNVSTGDAIVATFSVNNSGNIRKVTQVYESGTSVHFLVDSYLSDGTNNVSVSIVGRNTLAGAMAVVRYTLVSLKFTSEFDFSKPIEKGQYLSIPYYLEGAGVKYIEWYIDGVLDETVDTIADLRVNRTKNIDTVSMAYGKHSVQARAYTTNNDENFYSHTLYYDFVVCPTSEIWSDYVTHILLALTLQYPILALETITFNTAQYSKYNYKSSVYDSRNRVVNLIVRDNGTQIQSIASVSKTVNDMTYATTVAGTHTLTFAADTASASIEASVGESSVDITEPTDGLVLKLSARGRSNSESNKSTWTYGNISTTFNNFDWNDQSGWYNDALVIPAGASIDINLAPLSGNPVSTGKTIVIEYEVPDFEDEDATILNLTNSSTHAGLELTASTAKLQSSGGANVNTKYNTGDKVHLSFVINRTTGDYGRLMFISNNGVLERAQSFVATDSFQVSNNLHIGSTVCTVKLYGIKVYNRALSAEENFCNYAIDSNNLIEIADKNNVLNDTTRRIDADKVNAKIPIIIITGDMQPIFDATSSSVEVYVDVEYKNLQDSTKNFTATHLRLRPQGTSSLGYPRKNLRLYTGSKYNCVMKDANGVQLENGLYAFKDRAQPVNCWTLKADYAESSGSHNTGVARMWNDLMYNAQVNGEFVLRTEAQKTAITAGYDYDVRTTVDGFPIVVFHRQTADSELTCLGQYNFNNDKSTEKVFGFTDIPNFDNSHVQCFEFLENANPICLFTNVSNFDTQWSTAFESRYPDTSNPNLTPLKTLATWINSCQSNQTKWNNEKAQHFDLPKLAAYYVYLMRFGAVDQPVKNAMITTEDGVHWYFINYDNDTVLGIDNISTVLNSWSYERNTLKPDGINYYYAGHESVLWNCFEADDECIALVRTIDSALYTAGLRYANMIQMFDNEQCDKWCERIYNDNGDYKYIQPYKEKGSAVLYMLQGSRKSYRHWWLQHRMNMYDAKFATGEFKNKNIRFIAEGAHDCAFTITSAANTYFGYGINNVEQEIGVSVNKGQSHSFTIPRTLAIGDPIMIYNAANISGLDLSEFVTYLTTMYVTAAIDNNGKSHLKTLTLGDGTHTNNIFTEIGGLSMITSLEEIDVRGFTSLTNLGLSTLGNLHVLKASNSGLTSFAPANGASLTNVSLPSTIQSITMNGTRVTTFTYTPTKTLTNLELRNIIGSWDAKSFVNTWLALFSDAELATLSLTLLGINWEGMTYEQALRIGKVGDKSLRGSITLSTTLTQTQYNNLVEVFGNEVFNAGSQFVINAPEAIYISGETDALAGFTYTYTATVFPILETDVIKYILFNGSQEVQSQTDQQGRVYRTLNGFTLYEATGVAVVDNNVSSTNTVVLRVKKNDEIKQFPSLSISVSPLKFPSSISIGGSDAITTTGNFTYTKSFVGDYTANLIDVTWELSPDNGALRLTSDPNDDTATLNLAALPSSYTAAELTCTARFRKPNNGFEIIVGTKSVSVAIIPVTSFDVRGMSRIVSTGQYEYSITNILPQNYNVGISSVSVQIETSATVTTSVINNETIILNVTALPSSSQTTSLVVNATLSNQSSVTSVKQISFGVFNGIDATYIGNGSTAVKILGSTSNISSMSIDGATAISPSLTYTFNDTSEHTIHFNVSSPSSSSAMTNMFQNSAIRDIAIGGDILYVDGLSYCANLKTITLTHGVTTMTSNNIHTPLIERLYISDTVTNFKAQSIGESPVTHIEVDANNTKYSSSLGNCIVATSTNKLVLASYDFELPNSVTKIGENAYAYRKTGALNLPSHITDVDSFAFFNSQITSLSWCTGCNAIPASCFALCNMLKSVYIPSNVTSIGGTAFQNCSALEKVTIDSIDSWINISFDDSTSNPLYNAHYLYDTNNNEITSVVIPNNTTRIKQHVFSGCYSMQSITIPNTVTTIQTEAFKYCNNLSRVNISSLESWFGITFAVSSYSNPLYLGANLYMNNQELTTIIVPSTVTTIKERALVGCGCTSIVLPNSITSIESLAFDACHVTSLSFPTSITSIPSQVARGCMSLETLTFPYSITSIAESAFNGCRNVKTITCLCSQAPSIGSTTFSGVGQDVPSGTTKSLNVPSGSTGYTSGFWKSQLIDQGFTLNATL